MLASSIGSDLAATARGAEIIIVCNLVNRLNSRHSIRILSTALHQHWLLEKGSRTMECSLIIFDSGMSLLQELLKRGPTAFVCIIDGKWGCESSALLMDEKKCNMVAVFIPNRVTRGGIRIMFLVQIHYYKKGA